jgi:hypothetical protein
MFLNACPPLFSVFCRKMKFDIKLDTTTSRLPARQATTIKPVVYASCGSASLHFCFGIHAAAEKLSYAQCKLAIIAAILSGSPRPKSEPS